MRICHRGAALFPKSQAPGYGGWFSLPCFLKSEVKSHKTPVLLGLRCARLIRECSFRTRNTGTGRTFSLLYCPVYSCIRKWGRGSRPVRGASRAAPGMGPRARHGHETSPLHGRSLPVRCLDRRPTAASVQGAPTPTYSAATAVGANRTFTLECDWQVGEILVLAWPSGQGTGNRAGIPGVAGRLGVHCTSKNN